MLQLAFFLFQLLLPSLSVSLIAVHNLHPRFRARKMLRLVQSFTAKKEWALSYKKANEERRGVEETVREVFSIEHSLL